VPLLDPGRYTYPPDFNPADYLLQVVSRDLDASPEEDAVRIGSIVKAFEASPLDTAERFPVNDQ
jgi:hypothetical protein